MRENSESYWFNNAAIVTHYLPLTRDIGAQFERCLDQLFSVQLTQLETQVLLSKYGNNPQQRGMVCYRDFCAAIDASKFKTCNTDVPKCLSSKTSTLKCLIQIY